MGVLVMGLDPGFSKIGYSFVRLGGHTDVPIRMGLIQTKKSDKKLKVLASDDNFRRAKSIALELSQLVASVEISEGPVRVFCVEAKSFPRNASAAAKVAMFWGVLAKLSVDTGIPVVQVRPQEIKQKLCKKAKASKAEVQDACRTIFGGDGLDRLVEGIATSNLEHPYDSLATVVACLDSETLRLARRMSV
jgi:Holliday junction resolvasome RuvABC endonuclease subunit